MSETGRERNGMMRRMRTDEFDFELPRELIAQVMSACNNVQTKAAARLGINRNTLHKKLKEYDLDT